MRLRLRAASGTDPGQIRPKNEDTVFTYIRPPDLGDALGLLIVADGMGGHQAGEIASKIAVEQIYGSLRRTLEKNGTQETQPIPGQRSEEIQHNRYAPILSRQLDTAVVAANSAILNYAMENPVEAGNLGTTVACAIIKNNLAVIGHVGDSRVYHLRDTKLEQLTEDHSFVGQLVREGQLSPKAVFDHPHRSVITRAVGHQPAIEVEIQPFSLKAGDKLLLCSDGLWEMIRDSEEIAALLIQAETLQESVDNLIRAANAKGGNDNIAVVVCELFAEPD